MIRLDRGRLADIAGMVTLAIGTGLTVAPSRTAKVLGLGDRPTLSRTIGLVDLALVPGLLRGRPRWPWMVARAALNLVVADCYRTEAFQPDGHPNARAGAVAMVALTVVDGTLAVALWTAGR
jgi:hypothetical protein